MNKLILYLLIGSTLSSCGQSKKKVNSPSIPDLYKEVKFLDKEISYRAGIEIGACNFVLLINDVPTDHYFEDGNGTFNTSSPINSVILASGKQTFKLILYPGYKDKVPLNVLSQNVVAKITIEGLKDEGEGVKTIVGPFTIIEIGGEGKPFDNAGKTTAVYEGTFDAKVPYNITGWSKSKDLRKENPEVLLKEVLKSYQKFSEVITNKEEGNLAAIIYEKEKNYAQAMFLDKEQVEDNWELYHRNITEPTLVMQPVEKYKLKFYANGRLVTLERTDYPSIGESALRAKYKKNGKGKIRSFFYYLHKPEDSTTLKLIH